MNLPKQDAREIVNLLVITGSEEECHFIEEALRDELVLINIEFACSISDTISQLSKMQWDVAVVSTIRSPFTFPEVMRVIRLHFPALPVINILRTHSEDIANRAIRAGANDYVVRNEIYRLPAIIRKETERGRERKKQRQAFSRLIDHEELMHSLLDQSSDGVCILDSAATVVYCNETALNLFNQSFDALINRSFLSLIEEGASLEQKLQALGIGEMLTVEDTIAIEKSPKLLAQFRIQRLKHGNYVVFFHDLSITREAERALLESRERFELAARGANDGLWDWDFKHVQMYFSPRWKEILGYEEEEISESPDEWFDRVHPDDVVRLKQDFIAHFHGVTSQFENEHRILHKDGRYRWLAVKGLSLRDKSGKATRMAGSITDIDERKRTEERLVHDAFHDTLTGLPNRILFIDRLKQSIIRAVRNKDFLFAVLTLSLDRFNIVNETFGHQAGDQLIMEVAHVLSDCTRSGDTVARLNGDEFVVLLDDIKDSSESTRVAERILNRLKKPFYVEDEEVYLTASIGITISDAEIPDPQAYLRDSGVAMRKAKAESGGQYVIFDGAMHQRAIKMLQLESDLRRAIEKQEFELYFQPVVSLADGELVGFEALVRWAHPSRGIVSPAEFIETAERNGLIIPIDRLVLEAGCKQLSRWQKLVPEDKIISLNVNLSSKHFAKPELIDFIANLLEKTEIPAKALKIEITESALMDNIDFATFVLLRIKSMGIQVHIDDFGTGYSSLSYLHQFPIDTLKIDRSFVKDSDRWQQRLAIVRTIVTLARSLGMKVLAEGIESNVHLQTLRELECHFGQGFLFSEPLSASEAEAFIIQTPPWKKYWLDQAETPHH